MGDSYFKAPSKPIGEEFIKASNYQAERARLHKKENFSIGVFGLGKIGTLAANEIINIEFPYMGLNIQELVLFSRDLQKTRGIRNQLEDKSERNIPIFAGTLDDILETDICIFAADSDANRIYVQDCLNKKIVPQRIIMAQNNYELIKETAPNFKDYKGLVIMVTNQTDIMSYFFAEYSKINPLQIAGLNQTDILRAKAVLFETIKQFGKKEISKSNLEIYTMGSHDENMIPIISGANYNGLGIDALGYIDFQKIIHTIKSRAGEEMVLCHDTSITTAKAIAEVVKAAITETQRVSMSCYTDFSGFECGEGKPKTILFIGRPVYFNNLKVSDYSVFQDEKIREERKKWFNGFNDFEKTAFGKSGQMLENKIISISKGQIIVSNNKPTIIVAEERDLLNPKEVIKQIADKTEIPKKKNIYVISGKGIYQLNGTKRVFEEIDEDMRSLNFIDNSLYVGCRNEILKINLENKKIEALSANRDGLARGFNAVAIIGEEVYATHSEIGLAKWNKNGKFEIVYGIKQGEKSRFATAVDEGILFTRQNKVMFYNGTKTDETFECRYEISGLDYENSRVIDKMGNVYSLKTGFLFSKNSLKSKIIRGDLTKVDDDLRILERIEGIKVIHLGENVVAGSRTGWVYVIDNLIREKYKPSQNNILDIAIH